MAGPTEPLSLSLPVDPAGLAHARHALAAWLGAAGVAGDDIDDVLVACNEACMNAVEHSGASSDTLVTVEARLDGGELALTVVDRGAWREPVHSEERGHGIGLMGQLMDSVEHELGGEGTRVRMSKGVALGAAAPTTRSDALVSAGEVRGAALALVHGEVDLANVERVERELIAAGDDSAALVIDLTATNYLDSAGVHMLYRLARSRRLDRGPTLLVAPPGPVRRVLEYTGVARTLTIGDTADDVLDAAGADRA